MARLLHYFKKLIAMNRLRFLTVLFGIFFLVSGFSNCGGSKTNKSTFSLDQNPPFTIKEAYSQDWVAGIKGGGSGTILFITLNSINEGVNFENIFFRQKITKAQKDSNNTLLYIGYFNNELNKDIIMDINPIKEAENIPTKPFPFQLKLNEAVISYIYKEEEYYFIVSDITEKKLIAYPQSNPKNEN